MTQDEINQMVEQAGFHGMLSIGVVMDSKQLEAFAKLIAAKERQRTWVGLTNEEFDYLRDNNFGLSHLISAVEAKLKENPNDTR
jgi:hypothetical protein